MWSGCDVDSRNLGGVAGARGVDGCCVECSEGCGRAAVVTNAKERTDEERLAILVKRIELMLLEADASIASGDGWSAVVVHLGEHTERVS